MAKQLYHYWFVQFDFPNQDGKPYKSSGGEMVWNEKLKRDIPLFWKVNAVDDIAEVYNGATPSTTIEENYGGDVVWITPKDLSDQKQKFIYKGERNISKVGYNSCSTHLLPVNSILMSSRAPIGLLAIARSELCTNQGFKSFVAKKENMSTYLYYYLQYHIQQIEQLGTGTTFKEVSRDDILRFPILIPQDNILNKWVQVICYINDRQLSIQKENENLTKQRDELLPLLMNGQVSVNSDLYEYLIKSQSYFILINKIRMKFKSTFIIMKFCWIFSDIILQDLYLCKSEYITLKRKSYQYLKSHKSILWNVNFTVYHIIIYPINYEQRKRKRIRCSISFN